MVISEWIRNVSLIRARDIKQVVRHKTIDKLELARTFLSVASRFPVKQAEKLLLNNCTSRDKLAFLQQELRYVLWFQGMQLYIFIAS